MWLTVGDAGRRRLTAGLDGLDGVGDAGGSVAGLIVQPRICLELRVLETPRVALEACHCTREGRVCAWVAIERCLSKMKWRGC